MESVAKKRLLSGRVERVGSVRIFLRKIWKGESQSQEEGTPVSDIPAIPTLLAALLMPLALPVYIHCASQGGESGGSAPVATSPLEIEADPSNSTDDAPIGDASGDPANPNALVAPSEGGAPIPMEADPPGGEEPLQWPSLSLTSSEAVDTDGNYSLSWQPPGEGYSVEIQEKYAGLDIYGNPTGQGWEYIAADLAGSEASYEVSQRRGQAHYSYRARLCSHAAPERCSAPWEQIDSEERSSYVTVSVELPPPANLTIATEEDITYGGAYELSWESGGDYHAERSYYILEQKPEADSGEGIFDASDQSSQAEEQEPPSLPILAATDASGLFSGFENYIGGDYSYQVTACTDAGCATAGPVETLLTIQSGLPATLLSPSTWVYQIGGELITYTSRYTLRWIDPLPDYSGQRRYELSADDEGYQDVGDRTSFEPGGHQSGSRSSYNVRLCVTPVDAELPKCSPPSNAVAIERAWLTLPEPYLGVETTSDYGDSFLLTWSDLPWARAYVIRDMATGESVHSLDLAYTASEERPASHSYTVPIELDDHGTERSYTIEVIPYDGSHVISNPLALEISFTEGSRFIPIEISDCSGLNDIREQISAHYRLTADIDASCIGSPIGSSSNPFQGSLAGNGHLIYNLKLDKDRAQIGLFSVAQGAEISRLGLKNAHVRGTSRVGALIGSASDVSITNVYASVWVRGQQAVGGLIGRQDGVSRISNVYTVGWVAGQEGPKNQIGGLVGRTVSSSDLTIENSYSLAHIAGTSPTGPLVGRVQGALTLDGSNYFNSGRGGADGIGTEGAWCEPPACEKKDALWLLESLREQSDLSWNFRIWNGMGTYSRLPCLRIGEDDDCSPEAYSDLITAVEEIPGDDGLSIRLEWETEPGAEIGSYLIYRGGARLATVTAREYTDTEVEPHKEYSYFITPIHTDGRRLVDATVNTYQVTSELYYDLQLAMDAWEIDLDTSTISNERSIAAGHIANPPHWIATLHREEGGSCTGLGIPQSLLNHYCLDFDIAGVCNYRYSISGDILDSIAVIIAPDSYSREDRRAILTHEVGHCIGMPHWADSNHIMYPSITPATPRTPHPQEVAAAVAVYRASATVFGVTGHFCRPDNSHPCRSPATLPHHDQCPGLGFFGIVPSSTDQSWYACYYWPAYGVRVYHEKFPQFVISEEFLLGEAASGGASEARSLGSRSSAPRSIRRIGESPAVPKLPGKGAPLPPSWGETTWQLHSDGSTEEIHRLYHLGQVVETVRVRDNSHPELHKQEKLDANSIPKLRKQAKKVLN